MPKAVKLTNREIEWLEKNYAECTPKELSAYLGKPEFLIRDYIQSLRPKPSAAPRVNRITPEETTSPEQTESDEPEIICKELRKKPEWKLLHKELTSNELKVFEQRYMILMEQFQGDVMPTEETQIMQAIKLEIFMMRVNRNALQIELDLADIEQQIADQEMLPTASQKENLLMNLKSQKNALLSATPALTKERDLHADRHAKIMGTLKATREQRVKQAVDAKTNILGLLKLFQDEKFRKSQSLSMEVQKYALNDELKRLSEEHTYMNGDIDRPILNWETDRDGEETDSPV